MIKCDANVYIVRDVMHVRYFIIIDIPDDRDIWNILMLSKHTWRSWFYLLPSRRAGCFTQFIPCWKMFPMQLMWLHLSFYQFSSCHLRWDHSQSKFVYCLLSSNIYQNHVDNVHIVVIIEQVYCVTLCLLISPHFGIKHICERDTVFKLPVIPVSSVRCYNDPRSIEYITHTLQLNDHLGFRKAFFKKGRFEDKCSV